MDTGVGYSREIVTRPAVAADEPLLITLAAELGAFPVPAWRTALEIGRADRSLMLAALHRPSPDAVIAVAESPAGDPAGFVFVSTRTDYFTGERHAHVEVVAVAPLVRRRGVGRALIDEAERWASARGDRVITLNVFDANRRARALYARLGYVPETIHYRKALGVDAVATDQGHARATPEGLTIRPDGPGDAAALWAILHAVIAAGDTYAYAPDMAQPDALAAWHPPGGRTFVAERDGRLVGTYLLKANQPGLGDHVANCGYMVAPEARGQGVGEALCRHSLDAARALGFRAMQFNAVVSTNIGAVALWQRCGFAIVGTVPLAFRHPREGLVDIHVMHRLL
jgi:ribosomal protein S18 acetylase RimI-like enzyme